MSRDLRTQHRQPIAGRPVSFDKFDNPASGNRGRVPQVRDPGAQPPRDWGRRIRSRRRRPAHVQSSRKTCRARRHRLTNGVARTAATRAARPRHARGSVEPEMTAAVTTAMLESYPGPKIAVSQETLINCITTCLECSLACTACSDACMAERDIATLIKCVRTDLDCADMCDATVKVLTRQTAYDLLVIRSVVDACLTTIIACAEECERHAAHHKHCEVCAEVCRRAEKACQDLLVALDAAQAEHR